MTNNRTFLKCDTCGNVMEVILDSKVKPVCCGKEMSVLSINTVDASTEKHLPVAERKGSEIVVKIGAVPHPMTEEHHICWIVAAGKNETIRVDLSISDQPEGVFIFKENEPLSIYAYCNLHGLWAIDFA